jgi:ubiquinone/menaquinone biosynthesis C-methylase UbiE
MKRVVTQELLDEDLGTPEEIHETLLDLRGFNQHFGGYESMSALLGQVGQRCGARAISFLDVAGGTGEVAEAVSTRLRAKGLELRSAVLDRAVSHMTSRPTAPNKIAGDAIALPFANGSFEVVGCNLFCHHLEPDELVTFFNEALRVARLAVIASDLRRNLFHWIMAYAGKFTYRSRLTRNDAPASVRRAYTISELQQIAGRCAAASSSIRPYYFQRLGLTLWKRAI